MIHIRTAVLCLGLLSILAACSKSSDSSGASSMSAAPTALSKAQPQGQFISEKEGALTGDYGSAPEEFRLTDSAKIKCDTKSSFDSRVKAGDSMIMAQASATPTRSASYIYTTTVTLASTTQMSRDIRLSDFRITPAISNFPSELKGTENCDLSKEDSCQGGTFEGQMPSFGPNDDLSINCDTKSGSGKSTGTVAIGTYKMNDGVVARAQLTHKETTDVEVTCNGKDLGKATEIEDQIMTTGLVTFYDTSCHTDESLIYEKRAYKLADGTIVYATTQETLSGPHRQ